MESMIVNKNISGVPERSPPEMQIIVFDNNLFLTEAFKHLNLLTGDHCFKFCITRDSEDYFRLLDSKKNICAVIIAYNEIWTNTLSVISKTIEFFPEIKVIILFDYPHEPSTKLLKSFGVKSFLTKRDEIFCYQQALVMPQKVNYLSPLVSYEYSSITTSKKLSFKINSALTAMERRTIIELLRGKKAVFIANQRGCSVKTISQHKQNALSKIGLKNICELVPVYSK